jgi:hypothetical protein
MMRDEFRLFIVLGRGTAITLVGLFVLFAVLGALGSGIAPIHGKEEIFGATVALLIGISLWIAARWMFRTLQECFTRREARAVATAFAVFSPVWSCMGILFGLLLGDRAERLLGSSFGAIVGVAGAPVMAAVTSFAFCLVMLRITRLIVRVESTYP